VQCRNYTLYSLFVNEIAIFGVCIWVQKSSQKH